jgi:hypothetical protein
MPSAPRFPRHALPGQGTCPPSHAPSRRPASARAHGPYPAGDASRQARAPRLGRQGSRAKARAPRLARQGSRAKARAPRRAPAGDLPVSLLWARAHAYGTCPRPPTPPAHPQSSHPRSAKRRVPELPAAPANRPAINHSAMGQLRLTDRPSHSAGTPGTAARTAAAAVHHLARQPHARAARPMSRPLLRSTRRPPHRRARRRPPPLRRSTRRPPTDEHAVVGLRLPSATRRVSGRQPPAPRPLERAGRATPSPERRQTATTVQRRTAPARRRAGMKRSARRDHASLRADDSGRRSEIIPGGRAGRASQNAQFGLDRGADGPPRAAT